MVDTGYVRKIIRTHHECEIENPSRGSYCLPSDKCMTNGDREGRIFLSHPHTNIMAFFLAHPKLRQREKKAPEYAGI